MEHAVIVAQSWNDQRVWEFLSKDLRQTCMGGHKK